MERIFAVNTNHIRSALVVAASLVGMNGSLFCYAQNMSQMGRTADTAKIEMHRENPSCINRAFDGPVSDALKRICADQDREREEWIKECLHDFEGDTKALEHCLKVAP
jgi:hypothetical protein